MSSPQKPKQQQRQREQQQKRQKWLMRHGEPGRAQDRAGGRWVENECLPVQVCVLVQSPLTKQPQLDHPPATYAGANGGVFRWITHPKGVQGVSARIQGEARIISSRGSTGVWQVVGRSRGMICVGWMCDV